MADDRFWPIMPADEALFKAWLSNPYIAGWWQDGDTEWELICTAFDDDAIQMSVVTLDDHLFAFVQDYDAHHWPMPQYADQPSQVRAIDTFLGDPAFPGQGHGAGYLAARLAQLRGIYSFIVTDP